MNWRGCLQTRLSIPAEDPRQHPAAELEKLATVRTIVVVAEIQDGVVARELKRQAGRGELHGYRPRPSRRVLLGCGTCRKRKAVGW